MAKWWPGQFKYNDINTDGQIEPNNDRKIIGSELLTPRIMNQR